MSQTLSETKEDEASRLRRRVYVKNIPFSLRQEELQEKVEAFIGAIELCYICKNRRKAGSKTDYGFITFIKEEDALKMLAKRKLKLKKYKTKLVFRGFQPKNITVKKSYGKPNQGLKTQNASGVGSPGIGPTTKDEGRTDCSKRNQRVFSNQASNGSHEDQNGKRGPQGEERREKFAIPGFSFDQKIYRQKAKFHSRLVARVRKNQALRHNLRLNW